MEGIAVRALLEVPSQHAGGQHFVYKAAGFPHPRPRVFGLLRGLKLFGSFSCSLYPLSCLDLDFAMAFSIASRPLSIWLLLIRPVPGKGHSL